MRLSPQQAHDAAMVIVPPNRNPNRRHALEERFRTEDMSIGQLLDVLQQRQPSMPHDAVKRLIYIYDEAVRSST